MRIVNATPSSTAGVAIAAVAYFYVDRKNGWCCFPIDEYGNQIGAAEYRYRKPTVKAVAAVMAKDHGVEVEKW